MLDADVAALYQVQTRIVVRAVVEGNPTRFPSNFVFRLSDREAASLRLQGAFSSRRPLAYRPLAFTSQGIAMLSSVLPGATAVKTNLMIVSAFVQLWQIAAEGGENAPTGIETLVRHIEAMRALTTEQARAFKRAP
jgi:hypothetical protein